MSVRSELDKIKGDSVHLCERATLQDDVHRGVAVREGYPTDAASQLDYVFILCENIVSNRSYIYDMYARMFPTFDIFCQALDQCTEDYECLVISYTAKSNNIEDIEDTVFRYKTESHPPFCIG